MPVAAAPSPKQDAPIGVPVLVSLLMHAALIYFITLNIDWSPDASLLAADPIPAFVISAEQLPENAPIAIPPTQAEREAEAIRLRAAAAERIRQERLAEEQAAALAAEQARIAAEQEKIALQRAEQARQEAERLEAERQEQLRQEATRLEQEAQEEQERQEQMRLEQARLAKQLEQERLQQALAEEAKQLEQARAAELSAQLNAELSAEQNRLAQLNLSYKFAIRDIISRNWNKPISSKESYECEVLVNQIPGGDIVNVAVQRCNGDALFRTSVQNALQKVTRLPYKGFEEVFSREIQFTFKPE